MAAVSVERSIRHFHVVFVQGRYKKKKKCTKKRGARAKWLFCVINLLLFWRLLVAVAVVVATTFLSERTPTGSDFAQIFSQIVSIRVKRLSNTNFILSRHIKREDVSLPSLKNAFAKLPIVRFPSLSRGCPGVFHSGSGCSVLFWSVPESRVLVRAIELAPKVVFIWRVQYLSNWTCML